MCGALVCGADAPLVVGVALVCVGRGGGVPPSACSLFLGANGSCACLHSRAAPPVSVVCRWALRTVFVLCAPRRSLHQRVLRHRASGGLTWTATRMLAHDPSRMFTLSLSLSLPLLSLCFRPTPLLWLWQPDSCNQVRGLASRWAALASLVCGPLGLPPTPSPGECAVCLSVFACACDGCTVWQYPANGGIVFEDISIAWEYEVTTPTWKATQFQPACNCQAVVLSPSSIKFTWDTSDATPVTASQ